MAGERFASITLQATLSHSDVQRGFQTQELYFQLGPRLVTMKRGGDLGQYIVPDPTDVGEKYAQLAVQNMLDALRPRIVALGLPYVVSAARVLPDTVADPFESGAMIPVIEFDITATAYGRTLNLDFSQYFNSGWAITKQVRNASPIFGRAQVTDTGVFGSADGVAEIIATGGDSDGFFIYTWADGIRGNIRTGLAAGSYPCTVIDGTASPASTTVIAVVKSDARLEVAMQRVGRTITLVISGGVAPYTILWTDGDTSAVRPNLPPDVYTVTVTDAHGATATVSTTITDLSLFYFSRNPVTLELEADDLANKPNLRFVCEVWVELDYLSGNFVNVAGELMQPADAAGKTTFDVSTLLDAYVQPDFPAHGETGVALASKVFRRFYLQHSEQYDGSDAPIFVQRETHYLVYGGLDFFEYASQSYFKVFRPAFKPFLTWEPAYKEVFAEQPEYLYYHHDSLSDSYFSVQVKFTDSVGQASTQQLGEFAGVQQFEVWRIGTGLAQLRAVLGPAVPADVVAWEVSCTNAAQVSITETRYYQLSDELPPYRRYFLYANSVGGINTLACRGKGKTEVDFTSVVVQRSLQPRYQADAGETFTTSVSGLPSLVVNTGYLGPAQMEALNDFLLSEEIRFYDTDRYRPGTITPATALPMADDDAGLISVEFAFVLPTLHRYTPTLPLHF